MRWIAALGLRLRNPVGREGVEEPGGAAGGGRGGSPTEDLRRDLRLAVRTRVGPDGTIPQIRQALRQVHPDWMQVGGGSMRQLLAAPLARPRFSTALLGTFAAVTGLIPGAASLACYLPARRASRVDPVHALRAE